MGTVYRDLTAEELKYCGREILAERLAAIQAERAELLAKVTAEAVDQWLVWSNQKGMWWRADRSGYTQVVDEAGRYTRAEAEDIVKSATCDYMLKVQRTDPISGVAYQSFDEVMVAAPEAIEVPW